MKGVTCLLLCKSRTDTDDIYNVALDDADIGEMAPTKGVKFFTLAFTLLLLLGQAFMAITRQEGLY
jgi:hypothetical protein